MLVFLNSILKDVRVVLDHNETQTSLRGLGEDQLQLDDIIENQVRAGARLTVQMSPRSYLDWTRYTNQYGMVGNYDSASVNMPYIISMPEDYVRFGAVKMSGWKKAVSTYCSTSDEEYAMQQSEFAGVRATARKPVAVIAEGSDGGRELLLYPFASGDTLQYFDYCKQPKLEMLGSNKRLDIQDTLYEPFIYITASLVAEVLKDTDKSNELMAIAKVMLTVPEEAVETAPSE